MIATKKRPIATAFTLMIHLKDDWLIMDSRMIAEVFVTAQVCDATGAEKNLSSRVHKIKLTITLLFTRHKKRGAQTPLLFIFKIIIETSLCP